MDDSVDAQLVTSIFETLSQHQKRFVLEDVSTRLRSESLGKYSGSLVRVAISLLEKLPLDDSTEHFRGDETLHAAIGAFIKRELTASASHDTPSATLKGLVDLCGCSRRLKDDIFMTCAFQLGKLLLLPNQANKILVIEPMATGMDKYVKPAAAFASRAYNVSPEACLDFLRLAYWSGVVPTQPEETLRLFFQCVCLTASVDISLAKRAATTALAILTDSLSYAGYYEIKADEDAAEIFYMFYRQLLSLTALNMAESYKTAAFGIWARFLLTHPSLFPSQPALLEENYWEALQTGLAYGASETRRACLVIIPSSINLIGVDISNNYITLEIRNKSNHISQYQRFCTLFETIVLGKYLNQVQDSLQELTALSNPDSGLHNSWLISLLTAALSSGMQDSLRREIGMWVLLNGKHLFEHYPINMPDFLGISFLHWATLGYHFTLSVTRAPTDTPSCPYGEMLCGFTTGLVTSKTYGEVQGGGRKKVVRAILRFLLEKQNYILYYARIYLLEGMLRGIRAVGYRLDEEDLNLLVQISSTQGFHEAAKDYHLVLFGQFPDLAIPTLETQNAIDRLDKCGQEALEVYNTEYTGKHIDAYHFLAKQAPGVLDAEQYDKITDQEIEHDSMFTIEFLNGLIQETGGRCLSGYGLKASLDYLYHTLSQAGEKQLSVPILEEVLDSLWQEIAVQDYHRRLLMIAPWVFLHPKCVKAAAHHQSLAGKISVITQELQRMGGTKSFAYVPLAQALNNLVSTFVDVKCLPFAEVIVHFANLPPETDVHLKLEAVITEKLTKFVPVKTFDYYYGQKVPIGHACFFNMLNNVLRNEGTQTESLADDILTPILAQWKEHKEPLRVHSPWKRTTQLQVMLLVVEKLLVSDKQERVIQALRDLWDILALELMPKYRFLLEWNVARFYVRIPALRRELLTKQRNMDIANPKLCISIMKITAMMACQPETDDDYLIENTMQTIILSANPKVAIRHEAQWIFVKLWAFARSSQRRSVTTNWPFARFNEYVCSLESYKNPPAGRQTEILDPVRDFTLTNIIEGGYLELESKEVPRLRRTDIIKVREDVYQRNPAVVEGFEDGILPLGDECQRWGWQDKDVSPIINPSKVEPPLIESISAPLQGKSSAWLQNYENILPENLSSLGLSSRRSNPMILVASFVDNPHNLGGLSRASEIFGACAMYVRDPVRLVKNKDFLAVAVSSEAHLPIEELDPKNVTSFLIGKKLEGYTVIGIEQTDRSVVLGSDTCRIPEKCVLVLGGERKGIPGEVLADMDVCVEIKQAGVTRSLNVQTAAAAVLYEYSRQHVLGRKA